MKNFEHPEFLIYSRLKKLTEKYADNDDIAQLHADVQEIINENMLFVTKSAMIYSLMGDELSPTTREKLKKCYQGALNLLEE